MSRAASVLWRHGRRPRLAPLANHLEAADEAERKDWRRPGHEHGRVVSGPPIPPRYSRHSPHLASLQRRLCGLCQEHQDPARAGRRLYLYVTPRGHTYPGHHRPRSGQVLTRHRLGVRPRNLGRRRGGHHHLRRIRAPAAGAHTRGTQPDTAALRIHRPGRRRWWRWWWWWWSSCRVRTRRLPQEGREQQQRWRLVPRQGTPSMDARLFPGQLPRGGV